MLCQRIRQKRFLRNIPVIKYIVIRSSFDSSGDKSKINYSSIALPHADHPKNWVETWDRHPIQANIL